MNINLNKYKYSFINYWRMDSKNVWLQSERKRKGWTKIITHALFQKNYPTCNIFSIIGWNFVTKVK